MRLVPISVLCAASLLLNEAAAQNVSTNGSTVVSVSPDGTVALTSNTNLPLPMVVQSPVIPLSVVLRQMARQPRPGSQRFIAVRVEERAETRKDGDDAVFSTNYLVTYQPLSDGTNAPITWGAVKAKTIKVETTWPTKKGDEVDFVPVP